MSPPFGHDFPGHAPYTLPALTRIATFDLGRGAFALSRQADLSALAFELLVARRDPIPVYAACPRCLAPQSAGEVLVTCTRCAWWTRNWAFEMLFGLAYGGLVDPALPSLTGAPGDAFSALFRQLYDALSGPVYRHVERIFFAQYALMFEPMDRALALGVCTCGHAAGDHVGVNESGQLVRTFYAAPLCLQAGCACPYYAPAALAATPARAPESAR